MSNTRLRFSFKVLAFTLLFFLSCGFQMSFWPNIITFLPSPQIWLIIIFFISMKWKPVFAIFYIYFLAYCLTNFSEIPLKMLWTTLLITFTAIWFIKDRIQLSGAFAFITLSLMGSLIFEISYFSLSDILEITPTTFMFTDRLLQILMNFIFSYPLYFALTSFDKALLDQDEWQKSSQPHQEVTSHE